MVEKLTEQEKSTLLEITNNSNLLVAFHRQLLAIMDKHTNQLRLIEATLLNIERDLETLLNERNTETTDTEG